MVSSSIPSTSSCFSIIIVIMNINLFFEYQLSYKKTTKVSHISVLQVIVKLV